MYILPILVYLCTNRPCTVLHHYLPHDQMTSFGLLHDGVKMDKINDLPYHALLVCLDCWLLQNNLIKGNIIWLHQTQTPPINLLRRKNILKIVVSIENGEQIRKKSESLQNLFCGLLSLNSNQVKVPTNSCLCFSDGDGETTIGR